MRPWVATSGFEHRTAYWAAPQDATSALKPGPAAAAAREP